MRLVHIYRPVRACAAAGAVQMCASVCTFLKAHKWFVQKLFSSFMFAKRTE